MDGLILSGGKSSRMGVDKAKLNLCGQEIIRIILQKMEKVCRETAISANNLLSYNIYGPEVYTDIYLEKGPLAGLHSALLNSGAKELFVISCDMPFVSAGLMEFIISKYEGQKALVCKHGGQLHPLLGIYKRKIIGELERTLDAGGDFGKDKNLGMIPFLEKIEYGTVAPSEYPGFEEEELFNINDKDDYEKAKKICKKYI